MHLQSDKIPPAQNGVEFERIAGDIQSRRVKQLKCGRSRLPIQHAKICERDLSIQRLLDRDTDTTYL